MQTDDTLYCMLCREAITRSYTTLPYGSRYDGIVVCGGCVARYFDAIMDDVIAEHAIQEAKEQNDD